MLSIQYNGINIHTVMQYDVSTKTTETHTHTKKRIDLYTTTQYRHLVEIEDFSWKWFSFISYLYIRIKITALPRFLTAIKTTKQNWKLFLPSGKIQEVCPPFFVLVRIPGRRDFLKLYIHIMTLFMSLILFSMMGYRIIGMTTFTTWSVVLDLATQL
jgi:hypothetical protein